MGQILESNHGSAQTPLARPFIDLPRSAFPTQDGRESSFGNNGLKYSDLFCRKWKLCFAESCAAFLHLTVALAEKSFPPRDGPMTIKASSTPRYHHHLYLAMHTDLIRIHFKFPKRRCATTTAATQSNSHGRTHGSIRDNQSL